MHTLENDKYINGIRLKPWYRMLEDHVHRSILEIPPTPMGKSPWEDVEKEAIIYFLRHCGNKPYTNHLAIVLLVRGHYIKNKVNSIYKQLGALYTRLNDVISKDNNNNFSEWDPDEFFTLYMTGKSYTQHSESMKNSFFKIYNTSSRYVHKWANEKLDSETRARIDHFLLKRMSGWQMDLNNNRKLTEIQRKKRKIETDAILPFYPEIRNQAHLRWNRLNRLRKNYKKVLNQINNPSELPVKFHYIDKYLNEKMYFKIWTKRTWVLTHPELYSQTTIKRAKDFIREYSQEKDKPFLEFIKSENLDNPNKIPEGLWFSEIAKLALFNTGSKTGDVKKKEEFCKAWGYVSEFNNRFFPFNSSSEGILRQGRFISVNQKNTEGFLFNLESLFSAATFALLAIDIFTTTGARIGELLQISLDSECLVSMTAKPSLGAKSKKKIVRYAFRVVPKGRDNPEDFFIGEETINNIYKLGKFVSEHYDGKIPKVKCNVKSRVEFNEMKKYLFQFNGYQIGVDTLGSIIKFLMHGMFLQTKDGTNVIVKPHLLRHAFATHAVQVEKIPIDIVGIWLHQKNLDVTDYYSSPTLSQVAETADIWLQNIATNIDVNEMIRRSPKELIKAYNDAKNKVGTLNKVVGGVCSSHAFCPSKFACVGCAAKIPSPKQKHELEHFVKWSLENAEKWRELGLLPETNRLLKAAKDAELELEEIRLIEDYRKDEKYESEVFFKPAPLVE